MKIMEAYELRGITNTEWELIKVITNSDGVFVGGVADLSRVTGKQGTFINNMVTTLEKRGILHKVKDGHYVKAIELDERWR